MYFQLCGASDGTDVCFQLPERPLIVGSGGMQFAGLCRGINDDSWTTCAWWIDSNDDYVRFGSDAGSSSFTGNIRVQGQFQYEV